MHIRTIVPHIYKQRPFLAGQHLPARKLWVIVTPARDSTVPDPRAPLNVTWTFPFNFKGSKPVCECLFTVCVWRSEVNLRCRSQALPTLLYETGSCTAQEVSV